jgi:hypothetical protein
MRWLWLLSLTCVELAQATWIVPQSLEVKTQASSVVLRGRVVAHDRDAKGFLRAQVLVDEVVRAQRQAPTKYVWVRSHQREFVWKGQRVIERVVGSPILPIQQELVLFLTSDPNGNLEPTGLHLGVHRIVLDRLGRRRVVAWEAAELKQADSISPQQVNEAELLDSFLNRVRSVP